MYDWGLLTTVGTTGDAPPINSRRKLDLGI